MEDASPCMRSVRALEEVLRKMPIRIDDDELLVGVKSIKVRADPFEIERGTNVAIYDLLLDESLGEQAKRTLSFVRTPGKRKAELTKEEREELKGEIIPFWRGKTLRDYKMELLKKEGIYEEPSGPEARVTSVILGELPDYILILSNLQGHLIPGY
jgi:formate C-acetyltransferase